MSTEFTWAQVFPVWGQALNDKMLAQATELQFQGAVVLQYNFEEAIVASARCLEDLLEKVGLFYLPISVQTQNGLNIRVHGTKDTLIDYVVKQGALRIDPTILYDMSLLELVQRLFESHLGTIAYSESVEALSPLNPIEFISYMWLSGDDV